ncbi:hypothetical protein [Bradyrhizobium tropiciagri]|uniref:hypothetical protein n=1 Tax=Bradyrhizobium tropiciagri TaxID=312253 RepID=UPI00067C9EC3|nr:hypothetical protein [Bradyrhizobium tropiciagri]
MLARLIEREALTRLPPPYLPQGRRRRYLNKKLLAPYDLKWNPFAPGVPVEALRVTPHIESFCERVEQLAGERRLRARHRRSRFRRVGDATHSR